MANEHTKRRSTSFIVREAQIKTTVKDHCTPTRMAIITTIILIKAKIHVGKDVERLEPLYIPEENVKWYPVQQSLQNVSIELPYTEHFRPLVHIHEK